MRREILGTRRQGGRNGGRLSSNSMLVHIPRDVSLTTGFQIIVRQLKLLELSPLESDIPALMRITRMHSDAWLLLQAVRTNEETWLGGQSECDNSFGTTVSFQQKCPT
jgi:hypothetical protein